MYKTTAAPNWCTITEQIGVFDYETSYKIRLSKESLVCIISIGTEI